MYSRTDLHNHTMFSNVRLVDSTIKVEDLIDKAIELGLKGIAITDHELLTAAPKALTYFNDKYKETNPDFKLILGNEIYLTDVRPAKFHPHCILLAKDEKGRQQLQKLSSIAWINSYHAKGLERVDTLKSDLESIVSEDPGHLIMSTACLGGELPKLILALDKAEELKLDEYIETARNKIVDFILWSKKVFKDDFYFEVQAGDSEEQIVVNKRMLALENAFNVKIIATSDSHYLRPEDRDVHRAFLNSKNGEREVDAFYKDAFLHSEQEMFDGLEKSGYTKEKVIELFNNSMEIYNKIEGYNPFQTQKIPYVEVHKYPVTEAPDQLKTYEHLAPMFKSEDEIDRHWVNECWKGLNDKNLVSEEYLKALDEEARVKSVIGKKLGTNIFGYPILLQHYINSFWDSGSVVGVGRGSACAALNHYLLGLTQLNPLEYNFPFFRYLNDERVELPDVDVDLAPSKRPVIVKNIKNERQKYLSDNLNEQCREELGCVFVGTFATETTKGAVQRSMRGYRSEDFPEGIDVDVSQYISSLVNVERGFVWSLNEMVHGDESKGRKANKTFVKEVESYPGLLNIMMGIENLVVRRGIHASGVIMFENDPFEKCAFMKAPNGEIITQYDLHDCEKMGCTKLDFLVTQITEKIGETIRLLQEDGQIDPKLTLREAYDKYLHPESIGFEDQETWKTIQSVSSLDLFQFDSDIGRPGVKRLLPKTLQELSNVNALTN